MPTFPRTRARIRLLTMPFEQKVAAGLDAAYAAAGDPIMMNFDAGGHGQRLVCVSDLHRGKRDGADDFRRAERVYNAALAWYFAEGYSLAVLGDAEDLWEGSPVEVLGDGDELAAKGYARSLHLERAFNAGHRYFRVHGNHDGEWARRPASERLARFLGPVEVRASLRIAVTGAAGAAATRGGRLPEILLAHGNEGSVTSDLFAPESKLAVRGWAWLQDKVGASTVPPADEWETRERQDAAMYGWALGCGRVLIAGHTHRPVFATQRGTPAPTRQEMEAVRAEIDALEVSAANAERRAGLELVLAEMRRRQQLRAEVAQLRPCYFNTGACCFGDGQITAIEIGDGEIRLVRWGWDGGTVLEAKLLGRASLEEVLTAAFGDAPFAQEEEARDALHPPAVHRPRPAAPAPRAVATVGTTDAQDA